MRAFSRFSVALPELGRWKRYALALLAVALALVTDELIRPASPAMAAPAYIAAVLVGAWYGGFGPGLLATAISSAVLWKAEHLRAGDPAWLEPFVALCLLICLIAAYNLRVQLALRASEVRTRAIVDSAVDGIITIDERGIVATLNPAAERLFGYREAEVVGRNVSMLMPSPDRDRHDSYLQNYLRTGQKKIIGIGRQVRGLRKDGIAFPLYLAVSEMRLGRRRMFAGIIHDLTEQKAAEESLLRQQRLNEAVFDNILAHVAYLDVDFRIVHVNATYARAAGREPEQLFGQNHFDIFPADGAMLATFAHVRDTGQPHVARAQAMVLPKRGATYWDWWLRPIRDPMRQTEGLVLSMVDVTVAEQSRREVERLNEELKAAGNAKDQFLAVLSHELRTPLTPVLAVVAALESQENLPDDFLEDLRIIRRNAELEARLIDDLLDLTRIAKGKMQLQFQEVDVHTLLTSALQISQPEIAAKGQHVAMHLPAERHMVRGDPARLQQVFWNLIKNAVKFTPEGGCVGIRTADQEGGWMEVQVVDSGIGIDPEVLPRLFGAFEQGKPWVTRQFGGLGLGLAISKALVERHGGFISAHSEGRNKGSIFTVSLRTLVFKQPTEAEPAGQRAADQVRPVRILLVEDHADTAHVLSRLLKRAGHDVRVAHNFRAALEAARTGELDLVISDLGLPDGSGLDLLRELRKERPVKAIAVSGFGMDADVRRSREAGFVEHLTKPVDFSRLQRAIREATE